ncbi:XRE family transcriptional regulator [Flexivirga caeni]|uniref:XRE family transcriptional regulator n=2 Tax=Flexivirga caeni TaxID=2294115 RepID=A0A3M9M291_9MICO|nr:XRE family transcriptional regulator [Flexivirga caeni]
MRQLATMVGISNPYLSQIENGLRAPSEQVLDSIARSLGLSPEDLRAAEEEDTGSDLRVAIKADRSLTAAQRRALVEVYDAMLAANKAKAEG